MRHENSRFAPRTPCKARLCATFDPIRGGLCPLELPLRKRTADPIERVYRQAERKIPFGIFLFCDYPQVLLFAPSHIARKGECEGETFAGFPTRVQSPARRRPLLRSKSAAPKKKDTHMGVFLFWSGRRGSNSLPRPWQGRALPDELRPQNGASGRGRTGDTRIFSPLLYQLSYRGKWRPRRGSNPRPPA